MPGNLELDAESAVIRKAHVTQAKVAREERVAQFIDSEDSRNTDWYLALHRMARSIAADSIRAILDNDLSQVTMTEDYLRYLPDVSVEDCKQLLAWRNWIANGEELDSNLERIAKDWRDADDQIRRALSRLESSEVDDSVRSYLDHGYRDLRESVISTRSFWLYRAHPTSDSAANQRAATSYVDEFFSLAVAVASNTNGRPLNDLRSLILENEEIASCLDLLFVGLRRIDKSGRDGGSKESVESLATVT
jgi:hypothetical protein